MSAEARIVEVAIGQVKGFLYPSAAERAAAYELLVELTTRPSGAPLASADVSISEELQSIEEMFDLTRGILRTHGTDTSKGSGGNLSLSVIALRVLNEVFRPVVNRWRPLLDDHTAKRPDDVITEAEWERRWDRAPQCRSDLNAMRASVRAYIETLSHIAGTPAIADAILSAPSATMLPHDRIKKDLHPATFKGVTSRERMVRWFSPIELWATWRSTLRAKASLERMGKLTWVESDEDLEPDERFDAQKGRDFWFDYVADMGDAFDGTAPVAWMIGRKSIHLPDHLGSNIPTPPSSMPRADLVVFGGDEIYPFATADGYRSQTELPYRMGLEDGPDDSAPTLVAIPGNHDWLGGIEHFEKMFVKGQTFAEQWTTPQSNNWWHVALPQGWWLWGIDTGLHNELVGPQEEYFRAAAEALTIGDRVILCTPVPLSQLRQKYPESYAKLRGIFDPLIAGRGATMPLCLSGDSHYFAHFERVDIDGVEDHITAGGGGAFLQPTHNLAERIPLERGNAEFKLTSRWPLPADSRAIASRAKRVLDPQYTLFFVFGTLLHLAFAGLAEIRFGQIWGWNTDADSAENLNWRESLVWSLKSPWALALLCAVTLAGVVAFRGNSVEPKLSKAARVYGLLAGGVLSATLAVANATRLDLNIEVGSSLYFGTLAVFAVVGGVLSIALFLAMTRWVNRRIKAADTQTFIPANSTRFKHFLRFRIGQSGDLTCYVVGLDPVGEGWYDAMTPVAGATGSVPPYDPAGAPKLHYVWGKTYGKFVPVPLDIAVSISDPESSSGDAFVEAFEDLSASLLDGGHTLMYGGLPGAGITERLHVIDRKRHATNPNREPHLVNYVAAHLWTDDLENDTNTRLRRRRAQRAPVSGESEIAAHIANFSALRAQMTSHADVRVVIGGAFTPGDQGTRLAPGIVEEAYLAVEAGRPLLVVGGYGGAAGLIADALLGCLDPRQVEKLAEHFATASSIADAAPVGFEKMLERFSSVGVLRNGLSDGENAELLRTQETSTATALVMRSVQRLGGRLSN